MKLKRRAIAGAASLILCSYALAKADHTMGDVIVTATGTERDRFNSPSSISLITAKEITQLNAVTAADALEYALGVVVTRESGRSRVPSIRGGRSKHTLVLLDGRRLAYGFNEMIDLRQIPAVYIDRIEIVRGGTSALYGSDALAGVVNIITKPSPQDLSGEAQIRYGMNRSEASQYGFSGSVGSTINRFNFLASGEIYEKEGWNETGELPDDAFSEKPRFLALRLGYDATDLHSFIMGGEYLSNNHNGDQFYESLKRERDADENRWGYYLQYKGLYPNGDALMARVSRSDYSNKLSFDPYAESGDRRTEQSTTGGEIRYSREFTEKHLLSTVVEYRVDALKDSLNDQHINKDVANTSILLQDEFTIIPPLCLIAGARYDYHDAFGGEFSPRLAVVYSPLNILRVKSSVSRGFRAPSLGELYVTSMRRRGREIVEANNSLTPERATTFEAGVEMEHKKHRAGVVGYYSNVEDLIEPVFLRKEGSGQRSISYYTHRNIAEAVIKGVEVDGAVQLPLDLRISGHLNWQDIDNRSSSFIITGIPSFKSLVKIEYEQPQWNFRSNVALSSVAKMRYNEDETYSYSLLSAYGSKQLLKNQLSTSIGVTNILNKKIEREGVLLCEPTTAYITINMKF